MKQRISYFTLVLPISLVLLIAQACKQTAGPGDAKAKDTDTGAGQVSVSINPGYINEDKTLIEKEVEKFHLRYNSGNIATIYENSVLQTQNPQSMTDLSNVMNAQRKQAGKFESVIDKQVSIIVRAPVEGRAVFVSKYANLVLTEMFLFVKVGSDYKLALYKPSKGVSELPKL